MKDDRRSYIHNFCSKSCVYNCDDHPSFNSFSIVTLKKSKLSHPLFFFPFLFPVFPSPASGGRGGAMEADNAKAIWVCSSRSLRIKKSNSHCQLKRLHKSFNNVCTKNTQIYQPTNPYMCLYRNLVKLQLGVVQAYMQPLPCTGLPGSCVLRKIIESPMLLPCEIQGARHTTNFSLKLLTSQLQPHKVVLFCFPLRGSIVYKNSMIQCSYQTAALQHCHTFSGNTTL